MCALTFLALVVVSSPCSSCWFHGVIPKGEKKPETCTKVKDCLFSGVKRL